MSYVPKLAIVWFALIAMGAIGAFPTAAQEPPPAQREAKTPPPPRMAPLVERYILDELKALRSEMSQTRVDVLREITDRELKVAETVSQISNTTVTFIFYLFAILSAGFGIWGWRSIQDLKNSVRLSAEAEISRLSKEYENRLTSLEGELQEKGEIILANQREIERTQTVQALWLQANQAPDPRSKIEIYDRILDLAPGDPETMAYKADAALQLGDRDWALSLCNRILENSPNNAQALYQRSCARAGLGEPDAAMADLAKAIEILPALRERARSEEEFVGLSDRPEFLVLVDVPAPNDVDIQANNTVTALSTIRSPG